MMSSSMAATSSLWLAKTCPPRFSRSLSSPSSSASSLPPSHRRVVCRLDTPYTASELKFALHDALDSTGIDTSHARDARQGFLSQIEKLSSIERETSISINRRVDLGKTALYIAAEDDSLISHSSVPLPVDAFIERLDDLSIGYCPHYDSSSRVSRENFLDSIERYLYEKKGFRRTSAPCETEPRALYLNSVLTHRSGSAVMLSLVHSEILKMLRIWGLLDFDVEIFFPHDLHSLPRAYDKQKSKESDQPHIMTAQMLLEEMLRNLKTTFWPFQHAESLFLGAAHAANCVDSWNGDEESAYQLASAKAAQHRLERGVWTSVRFGDMRRALSACERLILLEADAKELRDYSILLYHCGLYEQSLQYLQLYSEAMANNSNRVLQNSLPQKQSPYSISRLEEDAVQKLMARLKLILMEKGWSRASYARNFLGKNSEPW